MKMRSISLMLLAVLCSVPARASDWLMDRSARDSEISRSLRGTFRPAFKAVETLSDGVYDFMRARVVGAILPSQLARGIARAPQDDSFSRFTRHLKTREGRYVDRLRQAYPATGPAGSRIDQRRLDDWRGWAITQQQNVFLGAFEQTFERYADRFAKTCEYAPEPGH